MLWPFGLYAVAVVALAAIMIGLSALLGERHDDRATGKPYESGIPATGSARVPYAVEYYVVAMLFVVFDLEAAFLFAWAVSARSAGWAGFTAVAVFVFVLLAGLVYEWSQGALDWGRLGRERRPHSGRPPEDGR